MNFLLTTLFVFRNATLNVSRVVLILCLLYVRPISADFNISSEFIQNIQNEYGEMASTRVKQWKDLMLKNKHLSEPQKLQIVNDFFNNKIDFVDDVFLWGANDYWATPMELLYQGAGDCEDYSIAKYFTLIELGIDDKKMRITYVKALKLNQAHMVLTYFATPRSVPLVLDNLIPKIKSATQRNDLLPVYSFNGSGLWIAKSRGGGKKVGGSGRVSMWTELKQRMLNSPIR